MSAMALDWIRQVVGPQVLTQLAYRRSESVVVLVRLSSASVVIHSPLSMASVDRIVVHVNRRVTTDWL